MNISDTQQAKLELQNIMEAVTTRPVLPNIEIFDIHDVYNTTEEGGFVAAEMEYRVGFGKIPNTDIVYAIIDDYVSLNRGTTEVALRKDFEDDYDDEWKTDREGIVVKKAPIIDTEELVEAINESEINWEEFVTLLADDTGMKDDRIIQVALTHAIDLPLENKEFWQSVNNHGLAVTQTGTGKSTTYRRQTGKTPSSDWSEAGLIGSIDFESQRTTSGTLSGKGIHAFDEFPEKDDASIMKRLLNYMESGEARRTMYEEVVCNGTKSLMFLGNPPLQDIKEDDFKKVLQKLSGTGDQGRIGRRLAHILYGDDFDEVESSDRDAEAVRFLRMTTNEMINQNFGSIKAILKMSEKWLQKDDPNYGNKLDTFVGYCDESIRKFIKGHSRATARLRMAGLKLAIIYNLDRISTTNDLSELYQSTIQPQAQRYYNDFKSYNLSSFEFLLETDKRSAYDEFRKLNRPEDIKSQFTVDVSRLQKWKNEWDEKIIDGEEIHAQRMYDGGISPEEIAAFSNNDVEDIKEVIEM